MAIKERELKRCNIDDQMENIFTKALGEDKFKKFRDIMGVQPHV